MSQDQHHKTITATEFTPLSSPVAKQKTGLSTLHWVGTGVVLLSVLVFTYLNIAHPVIFQLSPATAELEVSGLGFSIGDNYLLLPGDYQLQASAEGYYDFAESIVIDSDNQQVDVSLKPLPGKLVVESSLENIQAFVDGQPVGSVPKTGIEVSGGSHQFRFEKHRYFPVEQTLEIVGFGKTQTTTVALKPAWGYLHFSSEPAGAAISIDGNAVATTPAKVEVLETGSDVAIALKGHKTWQQSLTVTAGTESDHPLIKLDIADGQLQVNSAPAGAAITVDNEYRGVTPLKLALSANKPHKVSLFKKGFHRINKNFTLAPEENQLLDATLKPVMGRIKVNVSPADATIYIDGVSQGSGSKSLLLTAVDHRLEVKKPGYQPQSKTILPRPTQDQSLSIALLSNEQAYWARFPKSYSAQTGIKMLRFRPNDTFKLGAPRRQPGRRANEAERNVKLQRAFYLSSHEISNKQFRQFRPEHSSRQVVGKTLDRDQQPVVNISWLDAVEFCNWLSQQEGLTPFYTVSDTQDVSFNLNSTGYRLPTEAEWAWAAKLDTSGSVRIYPWANSYPPSRVTGNYADISAVKILNFTLSNYNDKFITSAPVGSFPPNSKGLYDMGGNVAEWVHDYYATETHSGEPLLNPVGPESGDSHVIRDASWRHASRSELRFSFRQYGNNARTDTGFRVARYMDKPRK